MSVLKDEAIRVAGETRAMLIGGRLIDEGSGGDIDAIDPATGSVITAFPRAGLREVDEAVSAAQNALTGEWGALPARRRAELLWEISSALEADAEAFAMVDALDNGKPLVTARDDVAGAIEHFRYMAGWATKINGRTMEMGNRNTYHAFTLREPVGVAAQIIPWNFPIVSIAWKVAPALAAGCAVVLKPSEVTSLSALRFARLVLQVGLPAGAINILPGLGSDIGNALVTHPGVDRVSFTGSLTTGRAIAKAAADSVKRVTLEMGGKSPVVVMPDADLSLVAERVSNAIFYNQGEVCTAGSRLLVHKDVLDTVMGDVVDRAESLTIGDGFDPESDMGPLVSRQHLERVSDLVGQGIRAGAELATGGEGIGGDGYFFKPTVLLENNRDAIVAREEIFGPVLVAQSFSEESLDRVIADVNDTSFGLGASIFTRDLSVAHRFARSVKAGTVWVNTHLDHEHDVPFGGYKQSGYGRELGEDAVLSYTESKSVKIAL